MADALQILTVLAATYNAWASVCLGAQMSHRTRLTVRLPVVAMAGVVVYALAVSLKHGADPLLAAACCVCALLTFLIRHRIFL